MSIRFIFIGSSYANRCAFVDYVYSKLPGMVISRDDIFNDIVSYIHRRCKICTTNDFRYNIEKTILKHDKYAVSNFIRDISIKNDDNIYIADIVNFYEAEILKSNNFKIIGIDSKKNHKLSNRWRGICDDIIFDDGTYYLESNKELDSVLDKYRKSSFLLDLKNLPGKF